MNTLEHTDPDTITIIESLCTGKPIPERIRDRLRAEGRKLTVEIRRKRGDLPTSLDLLRETRDE